MNREIGGYKKMTLRWAVMLLFFALLGVSAVAAEEVKIFALKSKDITSYNLALEGFREGAPDEWAIVEYDLRGTTGNTKEMLENLKKENPDLILAVGAKAATALIQSQVSYPIVFCMWMNPGQYDFQKVNITGVSLSVSLKEQLEVLTSLSPEIKRIGVLLRKRTSPDLLKNLRRLAERYQVEVVPVEMESEKEIPAKLRPVLDEVDALWMIDDAFIHSKETLEFVVLNSLEHELPFMAISEVFVKEGALLSLSPSFFGNGKQSVELVEKIVTEKKNPRNMPIVLHRRAELIINHKIARKINLVIPPELLEQAKRIHE